jgi:enoyl-CoA hydratase
MSDAVLTDVRDSVLVITLNRPDAVNAIDTDMARGLLDAVQRLDSERGLAVGVLTGAGRGFCSGLDLKAFAASGPPKGLARFLKAGSIKPLIAAIEGVALAGGLEIALTCDLLVAARDARFGIPEARVGLFAAGGALFRLPQRIPYGIALEMALTGAPVSAEEAHGYGLVNRLTESGSALGEALEMASRIAANAPLSLRATKLLMRQALALPESEFWDVQLSYVNDVFQSNDAKEGAAAFAHRRRPEWSGT